MVRHSHAIRLECAENDNPNGFPRFRSSNAKLVLRDRRHLNLQILIDLTAESRGYTFHETMLP